LAIGASFCERENLEKIGMGAGFGKEKALFADGCFHSRTRIGSCRITPQKNKPLNAATKRDNRVFFVTTNSN
jgi:hypothetical protein